MKKLLLFAATISMMVSCADSDLIENGGQFGSGQNGPIGFVMQKKNMIKGSSNLQTAGHYNFGVFAYKSTDKVNNIMADYLVGYYDPTNGYGTQTGNTFGDQEGNLDGQSYWMYEKMGHAEYNGTYAGQTVNPWTPFASNVDHQYLRYWDKSAEYTCFYAYAPYVNGGDGHQSVVKYVDGQEVGTSSDKYVMTIPNGTIKHGYDKADEFEFMYAWNKVAKANYGHDVALNFKRLNAKVNIKFWEDIDGYDVRIINVTDNYSVSAVPAIKDNTSGKYGYKLGKIYSENGAKIQFDTESATPDEPTLKQYEGTTVSDPIKFAAPTVAKIGENRFTASASATTYYAIPKGSSAEVLANGADKFTDAGTLNTDLAQTGLTFHVSYQLISTTGEVITVKDATVFVPTDYTNWKANTHYTYIFKITKNSNGTTDNTIDPKPEDPEVPTEPGLYPIVFDNCTVEDWDENNSEWEISETDGLSYHNITLGKYSVTTGNATDISVEIADGDRDLHHSVDYEKYVASTHESGISVTGPSSADVTNWYNVSGKKITVPATAASGIYTVTYTCPASDVYANHPKTWTAQFVVGHAYTVNTSLDEIGTNGNEATTKLTILTSIDGGTAAQPSAITGLSVEYPVNAVDDKVKVELVSGKAYVTVAQDATPGKYKLIYTNNYVTVGDEVVPVKVAEKEFEVKDYNFTLNTYKVLNKVGGTNVVATALPTTGTGNVATATYTVTGGFTVTGNSIAVVNNTEEGDYTVTLTLNASTDEVVTYTKTFNVQNQYTVALSKNTLNTTVGAANSAEYGSDHIDITSTKNGVADALSTETAAKYAITGLTKNTDYKIDFVAAVEAVLWTDGETGNEDNSKTGQVKTPAVPAHIKLQVKKSVAAGKYTVVYTGQTSSDTKTATADFVIQK